MDNVNVSVCLSDIPSSFIMDVQGAKSTQQCICFPIDQAHLSRANNGKIYLNMIAWARKQMGQYGDTHYLKMAYSKEENDQMSQAGIQTPIIGEIKPFKSAQTTASAQAPIPQGQAYQAPTQGENPPF